MSDISSLSAMVGETQQGVASLTRSLAALIADPQSKAADSRLPTMGRRMGVVTAVNSLPTLPLTADVEVNNSVIPGCSPQSTYRPQVGDLVWLEFLGTDPHISPPLSTVANRIWNNLTLLNGWSGYLTTLPAYWRDPMGIVHIEGSMDSGTAGVFAVLPAGFRPWDDRAFSIPYSDGVTWSHAVVGIHPNGNMEYFGPSAPVAAFLDGITFRID